MVDFSELLGSEPEKEIRPREVFMGLSKSPPFSFPRDIQTEIWKSWERVKDSTDNVIKLNVGSGKTAVGLVILQALLNQEEGPCVFVSPNNQLKIQALFEASRLGISTTEDPRDRKYVNGEAILITNIHTIFNGRSKFGVGNVKLPIGAIVIDDAHACVATVQEQFKIEVTKNCPVYGAIFDLVEDGLKQQNHARAISIRAGDPTAVLEVPFWDWQQNIDRIIEVLAANKGHEDIEWSYPLLADTVRECRCVISGTKIEIQPPYPPTDIIQSFADAKRRIFMTATLADDSILATHFDVKSSSLGPPIVPASSQVMGERMILMPEELNPDLEMDDLRELLSDLAKSHNVVVIVPSTRFHSYWKAVADRAPLGEDVSKVVEELRSSHVGLVVLTNRYDGIDLPDDACRVLAIFGLPEVVSLMEDQDRIVLRDSDVFLRRQIERIEQGMGRGVRSHEDYCVVLLGGAELTRRASSRSGKALFTPSTRAQMDLSLKLSRQLEGSSLEEIRQTIDKVLARDPAWVAAAKQSLSGIEPDSELRMNSVSVSLRSAFDNRRDGDFANAIRTLTMLDNGESNEKLKGWLKIRRAEVLHESDPNAAQELVRSARSLNRNVLKPLLDLTTSTPVHAEIEQTNAVIDYHQRNFLERNDCVLEAKSVCSDLFFDPDRTNEFEAALDKFGHMIGAKALRPENDDGEGPDNLFLWKHPEPAFVIEAKSGVSSQRGISKSDLGQLGQSVEWFRRKYPDQPEPVPLMVHTHTTPDVGATIIEGMRVITPNRLDRLKDRFRQFSSVVTDARSMNDVQRVGALLKSYSLTPRQLINDFTVSPR
jgi:hypothetical protein